MNSITEKALNKYFPNRNKRKYSNKCLDLFYKLHYVDGISTYLTFKKILDEYNFTELNNILTKNDEEIFNYEAIIRNKEKYLIDTVKTEEDLIAYEKFISSNRPPIIDTKTIKNFIL